MGMSSSDDDAKIIKEHYFMENLRKLDPGYESNTHNMNDDQKAIYDDGLKRKYQEVFGNPDAWSNDRR